MKTTAIIPAGGSGRRMGNCQAKQLLPLDNVPIMVRTLQVFEKCSEITNIVLVVPGSQIEEIKEKFINPCGFEKIYDVIAGGKERQDSVYNGLMAIPHETEFIVIHDAVRPFVTADIISRVLKAAQESGAAVAGIPVSDTVKRTAESRSIISTEDRHSLWLAQTPQIFRRDIITKAYQQAFEDHYYGTDDSILVERLGFAVHMVHGSPFNIKITTREDMIMGMAVLKIRGRDNLPHE